MNKHMLAEGWLKEHKPEVYWPMLQTAETVAKRYNIPREKQDEYGVQSQQRATAAQAAGRFTAEIAPMTTIMGVADKESGQLFTKEVTIAADEGIRADTTYEGVSKIKPAIPGGVIAAGNASQFSDGAAACMVMDAKTAEKKGLTPLGIFRGFAVAGCEPDEMGIGPVFAIPKLLAKRRPQGRRHRPVGIERSLRRAGDLLPRQAGHSERPAERGRRRDRGRPPVRHVRRAADRPRADRRQAPRREVCGRHHVHRRRTGRGRVVRRWCDQILPMTNDILVSKANRVLRIQLNRPDKKNALTGAMYDAMREAIAASNDDAEVRVVFIHGLPDCFTAGNDLAEFQNLERMRRERPAMKFLEVISTAVKPIVVAVNGPAVGIGTTMLLHCDLAYAGQSAKFQMPFAALGLCPEGSSSYALARMAGHVQAAELLMLGERFTADRALAIGLVNAVLPDAELFAYAEAKVAQLAAQPAAAIRATKALMRKWTAARVAEVLEAESQLFGERLASPEFAEAARVF